MPVYLANKTQFRADILKERGLPARRSLWRRLGLAHESFQSAQGNRWVPVNNAQQNF